MARALAQATATGDIVTGPVYVHSVVLSHTAAPGVVTLADGSGGTVKLTLRCNADATAAWTSGDGAGGVYFGASVSVESLTGTVSVEYS